MKSVLLLLGIINTIQAKDVFTINFIKSYIENERKPTDINVNYLGWPKSDVINLVKVLSNSSIKSASKYQGASTHDLNTLFIVDLKYSNSDIFNNITEHLRPPYRWLVLNNHAHDKIIWKLPLLLDSDFVLADQNGEMFTLKELYKPSPKVPTYSKIRGYYSGTLVDIRPWRELYRRRGDLMRYPLVMSNVIQESNSSKYHLLKDDRLELQFDSIAKLSWYVARLAFEMLNATPVYTFSYSYGVNNNNQWTGMFHDLESGRADLGTSCNINKERLDLVMFTDCIAPVKTMFIFRKPPVSFVSNIYILTFSINVWIAFIVCTIVSILSIYLESKWEALYRESATQLDGEISDAIFVTMSAVSQQGCPMEPKRLSGRLMSWLTFTSMMALYAAYSANIVVLLQEPSSAIKSLEDLAYSKITLAAADVDYHRRAFKEAKDPIRREIYKKIIPEKEAEHFYGVTEGVDKVRQGLFAFHAILEPVYRRIASTFSESEKCDLMEVDFLKGFDQHVPIYKHSPYLEFLRVSFKRIREAGIRSALEKRYHAQSPKCTDNGGTFSSIGIQDVLPMLLLIVIGVAMSVMLLIAEVIMYKITIYRQNKASYVDMNEEYYEETYESTEILFPLSLRRRL